MKIYLWYALTMSMLQHETRSTCIGVRIQIFLKTFPIISMLGWRVFRGVRKFIFLQVNLNPQKMSYVWVTLTLIFRTILYLEMNLFSFWVVGSRKITNRRKLPSAVNYPRRKIIPRKITPGGKLPSMVNYPPENYTRRKLPPW